MFNFGMAGIEYYSPRHRHGVRITFTDGKVRQFCYDLTASGIVTAWFNMAEYLDHQND